MHTCCLGSLSRFRYFQAVFQPLMRSVMFTHVQILCKAWCCPRALTDLRLSVRNAYGTQQWISPTSLKQTITSSMATVCIVVMSGWTPIRDGLVSVLYLPTFRHLSIVNKSSSSYNDYLISINRQTLSRYPIFGGMERFPQIDCIRQCS